MRVFLGGGSGLAGSAIFRATPPGVEIFAPTHKELELKDSQALRDYLTRNRIDTVILAAAKVGGIFSNSTAHWDFLLENLQLQNSVISVSKELNIENLLFLGSSCAYPRLSPQPIKEGSLMTGMLEPTNEGYAIAKISGIRLCKAAFEEFGLNYFSLMPTNLYGLNDSFDLQKSHVPAALMRRMHEAKIGGNESVVIWGTGKPLREFMSSEDLARACWHFLNTDHGGEVINIGTGQEVSIRDLAILLAEIIGFKGDLEFDTTKPDGTPRKILDISEALNFGWKAQVELRDGLTQTYNWFVEQYSKNALRDGKSNV